MIYFSSSFQTGVDFRDIDKFWRSFGNTLRRDNLTIDLPRLHSADDFAELFGLKDSLQTFSKPVVLFIDEFDLLYYAPTEVIESVLNVLRGIKHTREAYSLHVCSFFSHCNTNFIKSVVAIGTFAILELTSFSASPFNVREAVQVPYFTLDEVKDLFRQFEERRGISLDDRIVEDIFTRTSGYVRYSTVSIHTYKIVDMLGLFVVVVKLLMKHCCSRKVLLPMKNGFSMLHLTWQKPWVNGLLC